jgi:hypothetical protein
MNPKPVVYLAAALAALFPAAAQLVDKTKAP